jgi:hypothetical protein
MIQTFLSVCAHNEFMLTKLNAHNPKWAHRHSGPPPVSRPSVAEQSTDFSEAKQTDRFQLDWKRAALTGLSLIGGVSGATALAPRVQAATLPTTTKIDLSVSRSLEDLKESIGESFGRSRRDRREAYQRLDSLQARGILGKSDEAGRTLVDDLYDLNTQPLAKKVHRRKLMMAVLRHLDNPELMKQGERGACAAAGLQHVLAARDPAQYVKVVRGLASPGGQATLNSGERLRRVDHSIRDDSDRDVASRLVQSALIEYGNGPESYSNKKDLSTGPHSEGLHQANPWVPNSGHQEGGHSGLYPAEISRVMKALFGGDAQVQFVDPDLKTQHLDKIREAVSDGEVVLAGLRWDKGAHLVVIKEVHDDHLVAWNPWGNSGRQQEESGFDDGFSVSFAPMLMPASQKSGPEREDLNETGRFRISAKTFQDNLLVYEVTGNTR